MCTYLAYEVWVSHCALRPQQKEFVCKEYKLNVKLSRVQDIYLYIVYSNKLYLLKHIYAVQYVFLSYSQR